MPDQPTCKTCKWWKPAPKYEDWMGNLVNPVFLMGFCWRFPKHDYHEDDHYCGEHAPRAEAPVVGVDLGADEDRTVITVRFVEDFFSYALGNGVDVVGVPKPGDSFTVGQTTWIFQPKESRNGDS